MDWFLVVKNDWDIYKDISRIKMYVQKGKITEIQFEEITGEPY